MCACLLRSLRGNPTMLLVTEADVYEWLTHGCIEIRRGW